MTLYTPTAEDLARYQRLMLRFPLLRRECFGPIGLGCREKQVPGIGCVCHGLLYVAPPPGEWCGLLIKARGHFSGAWYNSFEQVWVVEWDSPPTDFTDATLEGAMLKEAIAALEAAAGEPQEVEP